MRRWVLPALMIILLLSGCGSAAQERKLDEMRRALAAAEEAVVTADVTAFMEDERFSCTLVCRADAERTTVEVTAPETIAGIRAVVDADGAAIEYESISLGIGGLGTDVAPVTALPLLMTALRSGSTLRSWTEREAERTLFVREYFVTDDTSLTVWFDDATMQIAYAEFTRSGAVELRCEIREFSYR